jgi:hypothetical protein
LIYRSLTNLRYHTQFTGFKNNNAGFKSISLLIWSKFAEL